VNAAIVIAKSVSVVKTYWGCLGFDVVVEVESAGGLLQ